MDYIINNCINDEFIEFINDNKKLNFKYYKDNEFNKKINELCKRLNKKLKIDLSDCYNISDVSNLGSVHTLNLSGCNNISDVSKLGSVNTLDLIYCKKIKDIGLLKNTKELKLTTKVYGIHLLKNIKIIETKKDLNVDGIKKLLKINKEVIVKFI